MYYCSLKKLPTVIQSLPFICIGVSLLGITPVGDERNIIWQTHQGSNMPKPYIGYNNPSSPQTLQALNAAGDTLSDLVADSVGSTQTGDLIELGFFDTDSGATITPNTDTTNLFHGIWTPITSKNHHRTRLLCCQNRRCWSFWV